MRRNLLIVEGFYIASNLRTQRMCTCRCKSQLVSFSWTIFPTKILWPVFVVSLYFMQDLLTMNFQKSFLVIVAKFILET